MDPENKQFVVCDDKLFKLIGEKRFRAFGFAKYLAKDLIRCREERERERRRERIEKKGGRLCAYARVPRLKRVFIIGST